MDSKLEESRRAGRPKLRWIDSEVKHKRKQGIKIWWIVATNSRGRELDGKPVPAVGSSVTDVGGGDDDDDDCVGLYLLLIFGRQRDIRIEEQRYVLSLCMMAYVGEYILLCFLKAKWHHSSPTINKTMGQNESANLWNCSWKCIRH